MRNAKSFDMYLCINEFLTSCGVYSDRLCVDFRGSQRQSFQDPFIT